MQAEISVTQSVGTFLPRVFGFKRATETLNLTFYVEKKVLPIVFVRRIIAEKGPRQAQFQSQGQLAKNPNMS